MIFWLYEVSIVESQLGEVVEMRANRLLPLSGIAAVVLIVASFALAGDTPDADAPVDEVVAYYTAHDGDLSASGNVLAFGALFFLIFATVASGALRRAQAGSDGASALAFGGGVLFTVGLLIFAGVSYALGDAPDKLDPGALQSLHLLNEDLFFPAAVGLVAFLFGAGAGILSTGVLPRWLGWVAIAIAILGLTPVGFFALPLFGLWILVSSVMLSMRAEEA